MPKALRQELASHGAPRIDRRACQTGEARARGSSGQSSLAAILVGKAAHIHRKGRSGILLV